MELTIAREEQTRTPEPAPTARSPLVSEFTAMMKLAVPVVLSELGWMAMGVVDLIMVGRLGPEAIGGVGIGNILYFTPCVVGLGLLIGLDTLVSQAFGARKIEECHRALFHGIALALLVSPILMGTMFALIPLIGSAGLKPDVLREVVPYYKTLIWGTPPLLLFFVVRRYLQGMNLVRSVMIALLAANLTNLVGNWLFIYGRVGFPRLGVVGSGCATLVSRFVLVLIVAGYAIWHDRRFRTGLWDAPRKLEWRRLRRLLALGWPAATQFLLEVGVFAFAAMLAGRIGTTALAAHEIVLHAASVTFMVPLGVSAAGAVRVGQAIGRRDPRGAVRSGWVAIAIGAAFMTCAGLTFLFAPSLVLGIFTTDPTVTRVGGSLLLLAALFQLFDGVQVVATGNLRGAGETRLPMLCNLGAHWLIGLPVGYLAAFAWHGGIVGLWIGLTSGLILVGIALIAAWATKSHKLMSRS